MKDKTRKVLITLLCGTIIVSCGIVGKFVYDYYSAKNKQSDVEKIVNGGDKNITNSSEEEFSLTKTEYNTLKSNYPSVIGYIAFSDEFVSEPIVQGSDNSEYMTRWIDGSYSTQGSVFMEHRDTTSSQNITLYGHHVFYDSSAKFSPISKLVDQTEYEQHKTFTVWFDDSVRQYEIGYVEYFDEYTDLQYLDYSEPTVTEFDSYKNWIDTHNLIQSDANLTSDSRWITLQTCADANGGRRVLVIAKETSRTAW